MAPADEKLHKVLARAGLGSRREMERWIQSGRVIVNGRRAVLGDRVDRWASISVDGKLVEGQSDLRTRVILYHKPPGEITSRKDPDGRRTVFDRLPALDKGRWIAVGRLDYNTSGLLLFTTDGELANGLMHPSSNIEREYLVRVRGEVTGETLRALCEGVKLEDGMARFTDVQEGPRKGSNRWYYVVIMEGRTREVRRLWESQDCEVSRLKRTRYGTIFIPSKVRKGQWLELEKKEIGDLYRSAGLSAKPIAAMSPQDRERMERQFKKRGRGSRRAD